MKEHNIALGTPEIANLWKYHVFNSAVLCVIKHFISYIKDSEIRPILKEQTELLQGFIKNIEKIFNEEKFPIPFAFSEKDMNLSAPALYTDLYALSFVYRFNQMAVSDFATIITKVSRDDVVHFFEKGLESTLKLYKKALKVMLSKGIYDRAPKISYPDKAQFKEKQESLLGLLLGETRPLNAFELSEIFYTIERSYMAVLLLMGLIQVVEDKEIKQYLIKGKEMLQKQIDRFNKILIHEQHLGNIPVSMEVTDSRVSPFSERLIVFLVTITTSTGIYLSAYSMSVSERKDLATQYSLLITEIMSYSAEGLRILIDRGWLEQPPQAFDRKAIYKS